MHSRIFRLRWLLSLCHSFASSNDVFVISKPFPIPPTLLKGKPLCTTCNNIIGGTVRQISLLQITLPPSPLKSFVVGRVQAFPRPCYLLKTSMSRKCVSQLVAWPVRYRTPGIFLKSSCTVASKRFLLVRRPLLSVLLGRPPSDKTGLKPEKCLLCRLRQWFAETTLLKSRKRPGPKCAIV